MLGQHLQIGGREHAAIEASDRSRNSEAIDNHSKAARRPTTDDRKCDTAGPQRGDGGYGLGRQRLVAGDQSAVDIRDDGRDSCRRCPRRWRSLRSSAQLFEIAPMPTIPRQKRIGFLRSAASRRIERYCRCTIRRDRVDDRLHDPPAGFDLISALEQRRVAGHAIVDQRLVARARGKLEVILIVELHRNAAHTHARARDLGAEPQRYPLKRLNMQSQVIRSKPLDRRVTEQSKWRLLELYDDSCAPRRQRLAGPDIKGYSGPAPIIDLQLECDIGLGYRVSRDVGGISGMRPCLGHRLCPPRTGPVRRCGGHPPR